MKLLILFGLLSVWLQPLDPLHYGPGLRAIPPRLAQAPLSKPKITPWMLPYQGWDREYADYFGRLTGSREIRLEPNWIILHYTVSHDAQSVWEGFARGGGMDQGDYGVIFGHPSVHFMIDKDGTIFQLLPLDRRCTGAYGLNHCAISIEMVAWDQKELLSRPQQVLASFKLVWWLMQECKIPQERVIGHFEVSCGKILVSDYLDKADSRWPYCYPPQYFRFDPGLSYMAWLHRRLTRHRFSAR
jgi:N-acetylmuramoyl-L-alanine amidase